MPREKRATREEVLEKTLDGIKKKYGQGSIMRLGDASASMNIEAISTGCLSLDMATGIGGVPRGRIVEIFGPESSGKTTLALHIAAEAQKEGGMAAFIDAEHALDPVYAHALGVDTEELLISQPDTGEQALEICDILASSGTMDVIVIDSVAALVPKAEIQGDMGDSHVALQARLMSQALRKLAGTVNKTKTCVIFINQLRDKVGIMFGSPETTTGGKALKFYASMRLDVRKIGSIKEKEQVIGNRTRVKVVKNKVAPPFKNTEFDIMYGTGVSVAGDILDLAIREGIVKKSGAWFSYEGDQIGHGREAAKAFIEETPELMEEIREEILRKMTGGEEENAPEEDELLFDEDGVIIE